MVVVRGGWGGAGGGVASGHSRERQRGKCVATVTQVGAGHEIKSTPPLNSPPLPPEAPL